MRCRHCQSDEDLVPYKDNECYHCVAVQWERERADEVLLAERRLGKADAAGSKPAIGTIR